MNKDTLQQIAKSLGWFSIGLGATEILFPGRLARFIGISNEGSNRKILRAYGFREFAAGVGLLSDPRRSNWIWGRVAGDAMDLASLGSALFSSANERGKVGMAAAAVLGVTALDLYCGIEMSDTNAIRLGPRRHEGPVVRTIIINGSPNEVSQFWQNAKDTPQAFTLLGSVNLRFERAPGGRGTLVRAEMGSSEMGIAQKVGNLFGAGVGLKLENDLRRLRQLMETGEIVNSDASIHPGMHAAQPEEVEQEPAMATT